MSQNKHVNISLKNYNEKYLKEKNNIEKNTKNLRVNSVTLNNKV